MKRFCSLFPRCVLKDWCSFAIFFTLNETIWLLYLSLTELDARPIYSALSSEQPGPVFDITSALYIIDFDKHSPRRGQECSPFLQLQFYSHGL